MSADDGSTVGGVPSEVIGFLSGKGGRSLIVKGGAGTGKTTFGLELLERVGQPGRSYYLSTRVGDEALYPAVPLAPGHRDADPRPGRGEAVP